MKARMQPHRGSIQCLTRETKSSTVDVRESGLNEWILSSSSYFSPSLIGEDVNTKGGIAEDITEGIGRDVDHRDRWQYPRPCHCDRLRDRHRPPWRIYSPLSCIPCNDTLSHAYEHPSTPFFGRFDIPFISRAPFLFMASSAIPWKTRPSKRPSAVRVIFSLVLELYLASARFLRIPVIKRKDGYKWCAA